MSHESFLEHAPSVIRRAKSVWSDFVDFVASENVLQVAVGLIIANGFTKVVQSLVSDILLPPIALLPFIDRNFEEKFVVLRKGPNATPGHGYNTLEQAAADGAVVLAYGEFITNVANFFALGVFLFLIARIYAMFTHETIIKHTVKCAYCRKYIPQKARLLHHTPSTVLIDCWFSGKKMFQLYKLAGWKRRERNKCTAIEFTVGGQPGTIDVACTPIAAKAVDNTVLFQKDLCLL